MLACRPALLILDEPTTGLDAHEQRAVMDLLLSLTERGHAVLFITHAMDLAAAYAHRVIVLDGGRVAVDAPVAEAFSRHDTLAQARLHVPPIVQLAARFGVYAGSPAALAAMLTDTP
ncbi:MAG: hypothetical protein M5R36_01260 [Deltaproteobacteria bacterium]|nr:hypothetical protein [Deltaproteobacteria bacterium]